MIEIMKPFGWSSVMGGAVETLCSWLVGGTMTLDGRRAVAVCTTKTRETHFFVTKDMNVTHYASFS
jgi:hypothetical protein